MNAFDILILILLLLAFVHGYRKGLIMQLVGLATIILAAIFGGKLAAVILPELVRLIKLTPEVAKVISYVLAFTGIAVVIALVGRLVQRFIDVVFLSFVNRLAGALVASGALMVLLSVLLNLVLILDRNETLIKPELKEESFFFRRVEAVVPAIVPYLNREFWEEHVPEKYREEVETKTNDIHYPVLPAITVDSLFQQRHFNVD
ncbi:MAG: CvpA family protein [Bacteroidota bacterium]|jgi:membrane protein required for colicin V production|nr:CvpA family protein [Bacteroidota bacterium]HHU96907.1 CvpA family protein [Petrimonas sp.]